MSFSSLELGHLVKDHPQQKAVERKGSWKQKQKKGTKDKSMQVSYCGKVHTYIKSARAVLFKISCSCAGVKGTSQKRGLIQNSAVLNNKISQSAVSP